MEVNEMSVIESVGKELAGLADLLAIQGASANTIFTLDYAGRRLRRLIGDAQTGSPYA